MNLNFLKTKKGETINGPLIISTEACEDERGLFFESWNLKCFNKKISNEINFVQDNISVSKKGVLRGLHYQLEPFSQGKLIRCLKGSIFDVIVDLREKANTFGCWSSIILSDNNLNQLWIPSGFAHGFLTISKEAILNYKVDKYWNKKNERSLKWDDKDINIEWPLKEIDLKIPFLSKKDEKANTFKEIKLYGDFFK